ncbi:AAA family ATPase [Afifella sp. H1R]|uniref:AAA family ATPase n=1 Tax=Afifella sp. H1R TaxID=2908841 RepID=UPI001F4779C2|nr:AAA family ATPase [Afifella sp. H1R]MCF1502179.1 AAA family ATPase [Afifella sp. H1R]
MSADALASALPALARDVLGDKFNAALSSKGREDRYGRKGSIAVDLQKHTWYDNEQNEGGGTLQFCARFLGLDKGAALQELERRHLIPPRDDRNGSAHNGHSNGYANGGPSFSSPYVPDEPPPWEPEEPSSSPKFDASTGPIATYRYEDEAGELLYEVLKYPKDVKPRFRQRRPAPDGGWVWGLSAGEYGRTRAGDWYKAKDGKDYSERRAFDECRRVLYRLPEVLEAISLSRPVVLTEGEKDALTVVEFGAVATCNAGGAASWKPEYTEALKGADVILIGDNDDAGRKHILTIGAALKPVANSVRHLDLKAIWSEIGEKDDITDWKEKAGGTAELFHQAIADHAKPWVPGPPPSHFKARLWSQLDLPGPEHEWLIEDFLSVGDRSIIAGPSRSGKSFLAIDAAMSVAQGKTFFGRDVQPGLVIYQAGEGARGILKRLRAYRQHYGLSPKADLPFVLLSSPVDLYHTDGSTGPLIEEIKAWAAYWDLPLRLVVIDTLSTATAGADENSGKDMSTVLANIARISEECACHVSLVHHMNAGGTKLRGHTSILANVDQVIEVANSDGTRTATLTKQKDGEDNISFRFGLKSVRIGTGWRKDGAEKPITSCVVDPLSDGQAIDRQLERQMWSPNVVERRVLVAMFEALKRHGHFLSEGEREEHKGVPPGTMVLHYDHYRAVMKEMSPDDERTAGAINKEFQRARDKLMPANVLGWSRPYMWHKGRPVRGIPETSKAMTKRGQMADAADPASGQSTDTGATEGGHDSFGCGDDLDPTAELPW